MDIFSTEKFGSDSYEVEVMVPKGSNSGIYVSGEYENEEPEWMDEIREEGRRLAIERGYNDRWKQIVWT